LRAAYLFVVVGLGFTIWPTILRHSESWPLMNSVVSSLLAGVSVLAAWGLRYPLQMLPVLLFELIWKSIWLIAVALPIWSGDRMDERTWATVIDCLVGVVVMPLAIPWGYVWTNYIARPGDPWTRSTLQEPIPPSVETASQP
jgi:hypothetical protein